LGLRGRKYQGTAETFKMKILMISLSYEIFQVIKSRRIKLAEHVAHLGEKRNACRV
jgi:hypothetical protein